MFKPDEANSYTRTVYCDVTGRESRLPLKIRGDGIGAKIQFSFDALDIENVFVNSEHSYEVTFVEKRWLKIQHLKVGCLSHYNVQNILIFSLFSVLFHCCHERRGLILKFPTLNI